MKIHLRIDHLLLDGLPVEPGQADAVRGSIEVELTRLLAGGRGLPPGLRTGGARSAGRSTEIHLAEDDTPRAVGRQIARALYGGISG